MSVAGLQALRNLFGGIGKLGSKLIDVEFLVVKNDFRHAAQGAAIAAHRR